MQDAGKPHMLTIDGRSALRITGVTDIDRFDEREIVLYTSLGELTVTGKGLHIGRLSIEEGELTVDGDIRGVLYGDRDRQAPLSVLGRLLR